MDVRDILQSIKEIGFKATYQLHLKREKEIDRVNCVKEFTDLVNQKGEVISSKTTSDFYFNNSIKKKTIFLIGLGKNIRGNLMYILKELNEDPKFEDYQVYVRTSKDTDTDVKNYICNNNWLRTETVLNNVEYNQILETAEYLIIESASPQSWVKKEGQIYINIWHGTPLKKLGLDKNAKNMHKCGNTQRNFIEADFLLYPNEYTKDIMMAAYKVQDLMKGEYLLLGYPRTGGMLAAAQDNQTSLRQKLAPNGERLYAYMPTWKDYLSQEQIVCEVKDFLDYMEENLSDDQILYVNLHHKVCDDIDYSGYRRIKQFPSTIDSYLLLSLTDALITDYSSVLFDYLALRRQIVLYCNDYDRYLAKRGTYINLDDLPFDKAYTPEDVLKALNRGKKYDDYEVYQQFCNFDSVNNAENLVSLVKDTNNCLKLREIPKSNKRHVLIYSHAFNKSNDTERLKKFIELKKDYILYVSCGKYQVDHNRNVAYPALHNVPVIGIDTTFYFTSLGSAVLKLVQNNEISYEKALKILQYDYELASKRWYGSADFDLVVIYDVAEPEVLLSLSLMETKKKMYWFSDEAYQKLQSGDIKFKDVLKFILPKMDSIYVDSQPKADILKTVCKKHIKIQKNADAEQLNKDICKYL